MERPKRRDDAGQRIHLRRIELEGRSHGGPQTAHAKRGGALIDPDQATPHKRLQSRRGQILAPQLG